MTSKSKIRSIRVSPAMIVSCVALFLALSGSALAVGIAKNSVRSRQIVNGAIHTVDLHNRAVKAAKIAPAAVGKEQLDENSVDSLKVEDESLTAADLGPSSVGASELQAASVGASQLGTITVRTNSVKLAKGGNGSVTAKCLTGERVLSGGGQPGHFGTEMTTSKPNGNGWLYQAVNNTAGEETLTAYALCLAD